MKKIKEMKQIHYRSNGDILERRYGTGVGITGIIFFDVIMCRACDSLSSRKLIKANRMTNRDRLPGIFICYVLKLGGLSRKWDIMKGFPS